MEKLTERMDYLLSSSNQRRADLVRGTGISEGTIRSWYTHRPSYFRVYWIEKGRCESVRRWHYVHLY